LLHKPVAEAPHSILVTVILGVPTVVNPEAVKVPVPAVETVIVAVKPVCVGDVVL
jgi:hypothetical protein